MRGVKLSTKQKNTISDGCSTAVIGWIGYLWVGWGIERYMVQIKTSEEAIRKSGQTDNGQSNCWVILTYNNHSGKEDGWPKVDGQVIAGDGEKTTEVLRQIQHCLIFAYSFQSTWEGKCEYFSFKRKNFEFFSISSSYLKFGAPYWWHLVSVRTIEELIEKVSQGAFSHLWEGAVVKS